MNANQQLIMDLYEIISGPERRRRSRWTYTRSSARRSRRPSAGPERSQQLQILLSLNSFNR
jgi:hypothetical protein